MEKLLHGTNGSFTVNINAKKGTKAEYQLKFKNFSSDLPKNLKFYYDGSNIDLESFLLINTQETEKKSYTFYWIWDYETENSDSDDLSATEIENLKFDIELTVGYEDKTNNEKEIENIQILPRSGDIFTNY